MSSGSFNGCYCPRSSTDATFSWPFRPESRLWNLQRMGFVLFVCVCLNFCFVRLLVFLWRRCFFPLYRPVNQTLMSSKWWNKTLATTWLWYGFVCTNCDDYICIIFQKDQWGTPVIFINHVKGEVIKNPIITNHFGCLWRDPNINIIEFTQDIECTKDYFKVISRCFIAHVSALCGFLLC